MCSGNGGEFMEQYFQVSLHQKEIKHDLIPTKIPQCNGVAERKNKFNIEMTRELMMD
ncbi:hypothetical protein WN48_04647 [Eufriesea mexicana]|uniref:Integrase catalytic domain-containing protein n=1 Tax=Eufriesea mexicana TaxID=516756 RepID=A0A310SN79_9HYME|nr:hypothetical protein WN48_04647 [Eufriesea mexicana]